MVHLVDPSTLKIKTAKQIKWFILLMNHDRHINQINRTDVFDRIVQFTEIISNKEREARESEEHDVDMKPEGVLENWKEIKNYLFFVTDIFFSWMKDLCDCRDRIRPAHPYLMFADSSSSEEKEEEEGMKKRRRNEGDGGEFVVMKRAAKSNKYI